MLETKKSLKDFILGAMDQLTAKVKTVLSPLYEPGEDHPISNEVRAVCAGKGKTPYHAQMDAICALVKGFRRKGIKALNLVAEMGTGKTLMGCFVAYALGKVLGKPLRVLIICPPTLITTWQEELQVIFGNSVKVVDCNGQNAMSMLTKAYETREIRPTKPEFWLIGFNRAKTSFTWTGKAFFQKVFNLSIRKDSEGNEQRRIEKLQGAFCDACRPGKHYQKDERPTEVSEHVSDRKRMRCPKCGNPLWGPDGSRSAFAPALFIKNKLPKFFDLLVADEVHKLKGGNTIQGAILGQLASSVRYTLNLTGTLSGGKASDIFYVIMRTVALNLSKEQRAKLLPDFHSVMDFVKSFGTLEEVYKHTEEDKATGRSSKESVSLKEKPGISPEALKGLFVWNTVFLRISDIADELPPYDEILEFCDLPSDLHSVYKTFEGELVDEAKKALQVGDMTVLGKMLTTLLAWPDTPQNDYVVTNGEGIPVASVNGFDITETPKDERLVEIVEEAKSAGRKVMVFCEYTGKWATNTHVEQVLESHGFKVKVMTPSVSSQKRLSWIRNYFDKGDYDVLVCNPKLVETGLNLLMFPEIVFYQTGYSTFVLRQASRRSWRPGQKEDVVVRFLINRDTLQEQAMTLIAGKFEASLALEGELSDKGLVAMSDMGDSMAMELARALVGQLKTQGLEAQFASYRKVDGHATGSGKAKKTTVQAKPESNPVSTQPPQAPKAQPQAPRKRSSNVIPLIPPSKDADSQPARLVGELTRIPGEEELRGKIGRRKVMLINGKVLVNGRTVGFVDEDLHGFAVDKIEYSMQPKPALMGFESWEVLTKAS